MKSNNKRSRKLARKRNRDRVNRIKNQQAPITVILFYIRLGLQEQNTAEKLLTRLRLHVEKLTGNVHFAVTDPPVADIQAMADDLEADIDAIGAGNKALIPHRNGLEEDAREMIRQLSYNIQFLSQGNEEKIKSAGFEVRKTNTTAPLPGQVMNLVATPVGPGKIKLKWDKDPGSAVYIIERATTLYPPEPAGAIWDGIGKTRRVTATIDGLVPGQIYFFRVYGTNGDADGNPSDPAEQRSL